ncbi:MAG: hypothetical protein PWQ15_1813 [Methanobacterium sp.]|nr:hypothetical protein [Methanobacterium sp.]
MGLVVVDVGLVETKIVKGDTPYFNRREISIKIPTRQVNKIMIMVHLRNRLPSGLKSRARFFIGAKKPLLLIKEFKTSKLPINIIKSTALPSDEPDRRGQVSIITSWSREDVAYIIKPNSINMTPANPVRSISTNITSQK